MKNELSDRFSKIFYSQKAEKSLRQGDLIDLAQFVKSYGSSNKSNRTELKELYPYFFSNYEFGVIITQCCDLEAKDGRFNVDCLQIAAIQPFGIVLNSQLKKHGQLDSDGKLNSGKDKKDGDTLRSILTKVISFFNHNTKLTFYYPPIKKLKFEAAVRLDVSISLKTECYNDIKNSRVTTVTSDYRSKLAWKLSDLYGRIGIEEYKDVLNIKKADLESAATDWLYKEVIKVENPTAE